MSYDITIKVQYTNNTEYRECIRKVFRFDSQQLLDNLKAQHPDFDTYEDETKDELVFDEQLIDVGMGELMKLTAEYTPFRELYRKAAALVISLDLDIGLAVLLSYDYFRDFHEVLVEFFGEHSTSVSDSDAYKRLLVGLSTR